MDHKETEEAVEWAEDTEGSEQQQQGVEQCNDAELYRRAGARGVVASGQSEGLSVLLL